MKKLLLIFLVFIVNPIFSQNNIIGKLRLPTPQEIENTKKINPKDLNLKKNLPSKVDNSLKPYFRGIFLQENGSCAQASGVGYNFTYEINRIRNTNAKLPENQFPSHFTYNFLNDGKPYNGSFYTDGWDIIKAIGCPNVVDYGGMAIDATYWLSGYQKYENGFKNRVFEYYIIDVSDQEGLLTLKNWLFNHFEENSAGGLANFAAGVTNEFAMDSNFIIYKFGSIVNHAMTIVGYDDSIKYDFNGDGIYTNDKDINNDGIVDMRDWEIGALKIANTWGDNWADSGFAYFMYRLLALPPEQGGIFTNNVWIVKTYDLYPSKLSLRVKIQYPKRNNLTITAGISTNPNAQNPQFQLFIPVFNKQGGDLPMNGEDDTPLELALDITKLLSFVPASEDKIKIFLIVKEKDLTDTIDGTILQAEIKNLITNETFKFDSTNVKIKNNGTTVISKVITFDNSDKISIENQFLPDFEQNPYSYQIQTNKEAFRYDLVFEYTGYKTEDFFPKAYNRLTPDNLDDGVAQLILPFKFPFYGKLYDTIYVGTDGWIKFDKNFEFIRTEIRIANKKIIAPFASDLQIFSGEDYGIFYDFTDTSLTIEWKTGIYGDSLQKAHFALQIFNNGKIKMFYDYLPSVEFACGISNQKTYDMFIPNYSNFKSLIPKTFIIEPVFMPYEISINSNGIIQGNLDTSKNISWKIGILAEDFYKIADIKFFNFGKQISENQLIIYPNPTTDFLVSNFTTQAEGFCEIKIMDLSGKIIFTEKKLTKKGSNTIILDLRNFLRQTNSYIITIDDGNKIMWQKFIYFAKK